ncbi:MAG: hypothetical protein ACI92S_003167, partial [Planctomycetaceae bacterium]
APSRGLVQNKTHTRARSSSSIRISPTSPHPHHFHQASSSPARFDDLSECLLPVRFRASVSMNDVCGKRTVESRLDDVPQFDQQTQDWFEDCRIIRRDVCGGVYEQCTVVIEAASVVKVRSGRIDSFLIGA